MYMYLIRNKLFINMQHSAVFCANTEAKDKIDLQHVSIKDNKGDLSWKPAKFVTNRLWVRIPLPAPCCFLEQNTFSQAWLLLKSGKHPNMTEILLIAT